APDLRMAEVGLYAGADIESGQIVLQAPRSALHRLHHRPVGDQAAEDDGLAGLDDFALEALGSEVPAGGLFGRESHGVTAEIAGGSGTSAESRWAQAGEALGSFQNAAILLARQHRELLERADHVMDEAH